LLKLWSAAAPRIQPKQSERFVGVVGLFPGGEVVGPTARVREPLRLGEISFTLPQSLFYALAFREIKHEGDTLFLSFEARSPHQCGHAAAVFADAGPFKRLQAPGAPELCGEFLAVAAEPLLS